MGGQRHHFPTRTGRTPKWTGKREHICCNRIPHKIYFR